MWGGDTYEKKMKSTTRKAKGIQLGIYVKLTYAEKYDLALID